MNKLSLLRISGLRERERRGRCWAACSDEHACNLIEFFMCGVIAGQDTDHRLDAKRLLKLVVGRECCVLVGSEIFRSFN